jgi:hypothetical protein
LVKVKDNPKRLNHVDEESRLLSDKAIELPGNSVTQSQSEWSSVSSLLSGTRKIIKKIFVGILK